MFRMRSQVYEWFKHIKISDEEPIKVKLDLYYLCLLLGLSIGRKDNPTNTTDIVHYFVEQYEPSRKLIVGLMLVAELKHLKEEASSKEKVQAEIAQYLDPDHQAKLTRKGFDTLNSYANGGFNYMVERLVDKPRHIEEFLQVYVKLLTESINGSEFWSRFSNVPEHNSIVEDKLFNEN